MDVAIFFSYPNAFDRYAWVLSFNGCAGQKAKPPVTTAALWLVGAAAFAEHVRRMLVHFDYGHHLQVNIALGLVHLLLWLLWWARTRRQRAHAWRAPAINLLLAHGIVFELADTPPLWGVLDGHALWHMSTVASAFLYWWAFVAMEVRWERWERRSVVEL